MESTRHDTKAYNVQSSSLFIDMRFPISRPPLLRHKRGFAECTVQDLRTLSRQHCFAGYTFPEPDAPGVFTRHHIIDWNYHPSFPRPRPNRWWVVLQPSDGEEPPRSFKEFSTVRDAHGVPLYFERWQRLDPAAGQLRRHLVLWRQRQSGSGCSYKDGVDPAMLEAAVLVLVGNHFALAVDRPYSAATRRLIELRGANGRCRGGGPLLVDYLLDPAIWGQELEQERRSAVEETLSLIGDYGLVEDTDLADKRWTIQQSTHPWREGLQLLRAGELKWEEGGGKERRGLPGSQLTWDGHGLWEVFDSSLSGDEIEILLSMGKSNNFTSKL